MANFDPTKTTLLRNQAMRDYIRRIKKAKKSIGNLIVQEDAFGLNIIQNQRFSYQTDPQKIDSFKAWLAGQVHSGLLFTENTDKPWMDQYIDSAYKRGLVRGYQQVKPQQTAEQSSFYEGGKSEFLSGALISPVSVKTLEKLYTRTFLSLKGFTEGMDYNLSRILAQGLADGLSPITIAGNMFKSIDGLTKSSALKIARTEIVRAYTQAQLDSFELLKIESVNILAEVLTAGDDKVCPECGVLEGITLTIEEARNFLPRHPNCRCAFVPAVPTNKQKGQIWDKGSVQSAINESASIRKKTEWAGADLKITGEGR